MSVGRDTIVACLRQVSIQDDAGAPLMWKDTTASGGDAAPKGAVMAFDLDDCPNGWSAMSDLTGRTIIGAGQYTDGYGTTIYGRGPVGVGGERLHVLSEQEMPSHSHFTMNNNTGGSNCGGGTDATTLWWNDKCGMPANSRRASYAGSSQAHNNMMPFMPLLYCKKD